ncbi:MAG: Rrf2 family transcriptional regulator [Candidatus Marinimicrobia bacterium]|nr:Rrf2 family transcriptional regulator [Candidatus Neomarinimicrobiota bacterium]
MQAVIYLAAHADVAPILQRTIAQDLGIPNHFLGKILQQLTRHNIIRSQKGKGGGFTLIRPPAEISLYTIIRIIDGKSLLNQCIIGFPACGDSYPCPVHEQWKIAKANILHMLTDTTVADLSATVGIKLAYIKSLADGLSKPSLKRVTIAS